jgi:uncharacterized membrane protein
MQLNIHPLFVHFPVAFFTVYSIAELLRFKFLARRPEFFYVKAVLVLVGFGGALLAIITGIMAKQLWAAKPIQLQTHENFAIATTIVFGFLALGYLVAWFERSARCTAWLRGHGLGRFLLALKHLLIETPLAPFLALVGLVLVFITGALGGSMVFGTDADPFARFVYHLLIK